MSLFSAYFASLLQAAETARTKDDRARESLLIADVITQMVQKLNEVKIIHAKLMGDLPHELPRGEKTEPAAAAVPAPTKSESWADVSERAEKHTIEVKLPREPAVKRVIGEFTQVESVQTTKFSVPIVAKLGAIPSCIQWNEEQSGFYVSFGKLIVRVPLPWTIVDDSYQTRTTKCKFGSRKVCTARTRRICNYTHEGEAYTKVRFKQQAPGCPTLGRHDYLIDDIKQCSVSDIRKMLMYTLSDLMIIKLWSDHHIRHKTIMRDVEICDSIVHQ